MNGHADLQLLAPWHAGEIALQRHVGVAERMADVGRRVIRDHLIEQHRAFYSLLPFVVLGAVDPEGQAWATVRDGRPGFLQATDAHTLHADLARVPADPADRGMEAGDAIGLLGIDLRTRRRNRLNGIVRRPASTGFDIAVGQSFGNCPQYIQNRDYSFGRDPQVPPAEPPRILDLQDARVRALITQADTFFVASYADREDGARQVDVSHRGGRPGFVRLGDDGVLTIPEFAGNLFFATLGNMLVNPRAGLVFVDFETGDLLQLTGTAAVILESPEIAAFQGAERLWQFTPARIVLRPAALAVRWTFAAEGWSPNTLMTGGWDAAASRLRAAALDAAWRPFRVARIVEESSTIRSFHLEPADGAGIVPHAAGQHLPIRIAAAGDDAPLVRTYTLSMAPSDGMYRISVRRDGRVSRHLHDQVRVGDIIEARRPAGDFTVDAAATRPAVLLAGGVGVTPMLAMLRHIVYEGLRTRRIRPTWFFQAARSSAERAFDREIADLVASAQGAVRLVRVLSDPAGAAAGTDYDVAGHVDMKLLSATLPFDSYDFYLCGPVAFMQSLYDGLRHLDVADARIHAEAFGPSSLHRDPVAAPSPVVPARAPARESVPVAFTASGHEARWTPQAGSLLELAEARGLSPAFSCRRGECGTCRTRIVEGAVAYTTAPAAAVADGEALICCAVPAAREDGGADRLVLDL